MRWRLGEERIEYHPRRGISDLAVGERILEFLRGTEAEEKSWINLVERWFAELTTKRIRRGTHRSVRELTDAIEQWTQQWNQNPKPFIWHKTAEEIFDNLTNHLQRIPESGH